MNPLSRRLGPLGGTMTALALALALSACASSKSPSAEDLQNKDRAATLLKIADDTRAGGDLVSAVTFYRQLHELEPKNPVPMTRLASTLMAMQKYTEAVAAWRAALPLAPDDPDLHRGLALALLAVNDAEGAMAELRPALEKRNDDPRLYNALGIAHDMLGRHDLAQDDFKHAIDMAPGNFGFRNNYGMSLLLAGDYPDAITALSDVANTPDASPRYRLNLALAYGLSGDQIRATATAREVLDEHAVQSNLASYSMLRTMDEKHRTAAILGTELHGTPLPALADSQKPGTTATEKLVMTAPLPTLPGVAAASKNTTAALAATPPAAVAATKPVETASVAPTLPSMTPTPTPTSAPAAPVQLVQASTPTPAPAAVPSRSPAVTADPWSTVAAAEPAKALSATPATAPVGQVASVPPAPAPETSTPAVAPPAPVAEAASPPSQVAMVTPPPSDPAPVARPAVLPAVHQVAVAKHDRPVEHASVTTSAGEHYVVQLGSFSVEAFAQNLVQRFAAKGVTLQMVRSVDRQQRIWYVVRTAEYASASAAQDALHQVQAIGGVQPAVVRSSALLPAASNPSTVPPVAAAAPARPAEQAAMPVSESKTTSDSDDSGPR